MHGVVFDFPRTDPTPFAILSGLSAIKRVARDYFLALNCLSSFLIEFIML